MASVDLGLHACVVFSVSQVKVERKALRTMMLWWGDGGTWL